MLCFDHTQGFSTKMMFHSLFNKMCGLNQEQCKNILKIKGSLSVGLEPVPNFSVSATKELAVSQENWSSSSTLLV